MGVGAGSKGGFREFQNRVLEYAQRKCLVTPLEEMDLSIKTRFILIMEDRGLAPKKDPIDLNELIIKHRILFLNWYLLERGHQDGETIAMLYLESDEYDERFGPPSELYSEVEGLRSPEHGVFVITKKIGKGFFNLQPLGKEGNLKVYDKSGYGKLKEGQVIYCILYPFKGVYYWGTKHAILIPKEAADEYLKKLEENRRNEELIDLFLDSIEHSLSEETLSKYWESLYTLTDYLIDTNRGGIWNVDYPALEEFFSTWYPNKILYSTSYGAKGLFATIRRFYTWLADEKGIPQPSEHMKVIYEEIRGDLLRLLALKRMIREKRRLRKDSKMYLWFEEENMKIEGRYQVKEIKGSEISLRDIHKNVNYNTRIQEKDAWFLEHLAQGDVFSGSLTKTKESIQLEMDDIYYLCPSQSVKYLNKYL